MSSQASLTPQKRAVQVDDSAAAAGRPESKPRKRNQGPDVPAACGDKPKPPGLGFSPVGQPQSCTGAKGNVDGNPSATQAAVQSLKTTYQWVMKGAAEREEIEKKLQATEAEVAELRHKLMERDAELQATESEVAELRHKLMERDAVVARLIQEHAAEVARLKQVAEKMGILQQEMLKTLETRQ